MQEIQQKWQLRRMTQGFELKISRKTVRTLAKIGDTRERR